MVSWPIRCLTFVKFPGTIQIISNISTGLTLALRVYALYGRALVRGTSIFTWRPLLIRYGSQWVFAILAPFFVVEIVLESVSLVGQVSELHWLRMSVGCCRGRSGTCSRWYAALPLISDECQANDDCQAKPDASSQANPISKCLSSHTCLNNLLNFSQGRSYVVILPCADIPMTH